MIDWQESYSLESVRLYRVDVGTWADAEEVGGIETMTVQRSASGTAPLIESGSVTIDVPLGQTVSEGYYRIVAYAVQSGSTERVEVATLHCAATSGTANGGIAETSVTGRSVLYPASTEKLARGSYAPAGVDGMQYAADLLRGSCAAPVTVDGSFTIDQAVVFDSGSSILTAAWKVLNAGNGCIRISGDGTIHVGPMPEEPALVIDRYSTGMLMPTVKSNTDMTKMPNRYTAIQGGVTETVANDDPTSVTSTAWRGYVSDVVDKSPKRVNGETLRSYCARKLEEASVLKIPYSYAREYWPNVVPYDIIRTNVPSVGLLADMRVSKQKVTLAGGILVEETAESEEQLWRA
jgi:hypothetical protein